MRSLIIYKQNDGNIYHCDLDDNTAIGVDIQVFDPAKPDVSRVNCSNEFSVPKTRNNISIFDGIFNPGQIISENKYECDYFVDNHRLISGIVYLTGSTSDRITMFIYDKHSILAELKSIKFSDFEKEFLDSSYYDMADWPKEKNAPGYTQEGDMTNCFPVVLHPQPISSLPKDLFKESCVSLYNSEVAQSLADVKANLAKWVNKLDPLTNLCTLWNATISSWTMAFMNYYNPDDRYEPVIGQGQQGYIYPISYAFSNECAQTRSNLLNRSSEDYPTLFDKKKLLMANECYLIMGIDHRQDGKCDNMYIGGYPLYNQRGNQASTGRTRSKAWGVSKWRVADDLSTVDELSFGEYDISIPEDDLGAKIDYLDSKLSEWHTYYKKVHTAPGGFDSSSYPTRTWWVNNNNTGHYRDDSDNIERDTPNLYLVLKRILNLIKNAYRNQSFQGGNGEGTTKADMLALIYSMGADNYNTVRQKLDAIVRNINIQQPTLWGSMAADGVSVTNSGRTSLCWDNYNESLQYWHCDNESDYTVYSNAYIAVYYSDTIISVPPSMYMTVAKWNQNYNVTTPYTQSFVYIAELCRQLISPTLAPSCITAEQLNQFNAIQVYTADRPPFKFIPTSSSEDDVFTVNAYGTVTKLTMTMAKLDGDALQYNSGSLYASSYSILTKLASRFNAQIEKDIEWSNWYTNFPDLVITTNSDYWWWDINQAGEKSKTSSPRNKTMYDWLMMFCKVHSLVPVIDNNYNQWDPVSQTTYTTRLRFRKYGQQEAIDMLDADMFDLRLGSEWKGDGGYQNSVNYIDFSSTEEGLDKRAVSNPVIIANPALNNEPQTLYTNGVHRMKVAIPNNKPNIWQTKGSEDFQYIYAMSADGNEIASPMVYNIAESEIELDAVIGSNTYTMKDADNNTAHMWYIPNIGQYIKQPEVDVTFLNRLVGNPYPIVYEVDAYADLDDLMDVFINRENMAVYRFKDLQGYYYITKVEGINGYNRKSPVKLTLIRYK